MKDYEKKGQIGGSILTVVSLIVSVGVSVLVLIFVGSLGGQTYELVEADIDSLSIAAGTSSDITVLNSTAVSLTHTSLQSTPLAYKAGTLVTGNFTYGLEAGTVTLIDNANNNTAFNFTYNWRNETIPSAIKSGIISGFEALESTGDYLPLIVMALVIVIVLGMTLGITGAGGSFGGKGGQNTAL